MSKHTDISTEALREAIRAEGKNRYTFKDLLPLTARNADIPLVLARPLLSAAFRVIAAALLEEKTVVIPRVGTLKTGTVSSYWGSGVVGDRVAVKKHVRIHFRAAEALKRRFKEAG